MNKIYDKRLISLFIIIQPLLDVLTYFSNLKFGFSIGMILRGAFLAYAMIYILFFSKNKKTNIVFCGLIFTYLLIYFAFNCSNMSIILYKIPALFKFLYFPIITLFFYEAYNVKLKNKVLLVATLICMLMIVSQLFGNVVLSYESAKLGNSGWFFSPNELSAICSIIFPLVYAYFIENINKFGFIILTLLTLCMLLIGTKTAYLAVALTLIMYIFYFIFGFFKKKTKYKQQLIITFILLILFASLTPVTYAYKNIHIQNSNSISDFVLNGRDNIKETNLESGENFYDSFNKLIGVKLNQKIEYEFERDFYNIYYNYGIIGIVIYFMVPLYILVLKIREAKKEKTIKFNCTKYAALISVLIALGVAYISGHTLLSPAVCIYLSLVLLILIYKAGDNSKKRVLFISSVGGHLTQLLELKRVFNDYEYLLITEKTDVTISMNTKYNMKFLIYGSRKYLLKYLFIFTYNIFKSICLFVKYTPDTIVTTGTHTAVPMCYIGWLFNKKVIYIESFAKRTSPTLTGRIVYPVSTTFVVQWKSMLKFYPRAKYWGGIY